MTRTSFFTQGNTRIPKSDEERSSSRFFREEFWSSRRNTAARCFAIIWQRRETGRSTTRRRRPWIIKKPKISRHPVYRYAGTVAPVNLAGASIRPSAIRLWCSLIGGKCPGRRSADPGTPLDLPLALPASRATQSVAFDSLAVGESPGDSGRIPNQNPD